ncbi:L,D-transpeptidase [Pediococcus ethanolidurans]|uniref:ErfK YbiS YcfS YnhG family protein n=1 Tax=Pediococcus ethanolidurans TaxID=319653 RepID=A0A0R2K0W4_9LACO|nr:L,D-transpeptidase [Pediococcus ethanolidurans]KRN81366.1 ErfK YbiS YcfS YnhG family protein [Pediococcus ethanolidurans]GEN95927.1 cell surface protein [Pediococcus ethanolidurans]SER91129.1 Putative peptidoglycan binding domain-containing protein [Pediococcus ethanolidurans]
MTKNNHWLRWVLIGLGILIVGGGLFAWQYGQTHFAPKTTIDGKSVAGLTANQATQKLAASSSTITNRVYLNGKLLVTGKSQTVSSVTKTQVKDALKKHHGLFASSSKSSAVALTNSDKVVTYRNNTLKKQVTQALKTYNKTATAAHPTYYYLKNGSIKTQAAAKGNQVTVTKALASYDNQVKQLKDIKLKTSSSTATQSETAAAKAVKQNLKDSLTKTLIYHVGGKNYTLKGSDYIVNTQPGKTPTVDLTALEAKLTKINDSDSTQGKSFSVKLLNSGKTITTNNTTASNYGWSLNVKSEAKMLADKFINASVKSNTKVDMKNYSGQNISYNRSSAIGSTRVEINLSTLHEYIYVNGKLKENIPVMSGTLSGSDKTPTGLFHILYKQSPSTLTGKNDNGSAYASKVSYWEPLTEDGVGMHDSSWQPSKVYGNTSYRSTYHSHGCLNNPPSKMKSVWENTSTTEPVIIYK